MSPGGAVLAGAGVSQWHNGSALPPALPLALLLAICSDGAWVMHRWLVRPHEFRQAATPPSSKTSRPMPLTPP